jgi:hypothetical protein
LWILQLAYVLVAHLSEHFYYFLYSPEACWIFNNLYKLIRADLQAAKQRKEQQQQQRKSANSQQAEMNSQNQWQGSPMTGWARTIGMFIAHGRHKLFSAELYMHEGEEGQEVAEQLLGPLEELMAVFPAAGAGSLAKNLIHEDQQFGQLMKLQNLLVPH